MKSYLELARPHAAALAFFGTTLGWRLSGAEHTALEVFYLAVSTSLLCSGSMILNDSYNEAEDRINKPDRPVPSGRVERELALVLGGSAFCLAILLAARVSLALALGALLVLAASVGYSLWLKGVMLVGNVVVAVVQAYPLWCWALAGAELRGPFLLITVCCCVYFLGEELIKLAEDVEGDSACGISTLATVRGAWFSQVAGVTLLVLALLPACVPVLLAAPSRSYALGVASCLLVAMAPSIQQASRNLRALSPSRLLLTSRLIKVIMLAACTFQLFSQTVSVGKLV